MKRKWILISPQTLVLDTWVTLTWEDTRMSFLHCLEERPHLQGLSQPVDQEFAAALWRPPLEMGSTVNVEEIPAFKSTRQFW